MDEHLLIVAAFEPELEPLRKTLHGDKNVSFFAAGIGSIAAAAGLSKYLATLNQPTNVIFVGSAGCHDPSVPLLTLVSATCAIIADATLISEQSYLPDPYIRDHKASSELLENLHSVIPSVLCEPIASTVSITRDSNLAKNYCHSLNCRFENLELFGIATACSQHGTPWGSLCCVTNYTGPSAHNEWISNFKRASELTAAAIKEMRGHGAFAGT